VHFEDLQSDAPAAAPALVEPALGASVRVHPHRFDPRLPADVRLVRWPAEHEQRADLAALELPRILVVAAGERAPEWCDEIEDWVRAPVDRAELELRAATVAVRADLRTKPWVDEYGVLWFRDRWHALAEGQLPLLRVLVDEFGRVVPQEAVLAAYAAAGRSTHAEAVKTSARRLTGALAPLGLELCRVRGRGYLLERLP
jgi:hypothetical protein